MSYETVILELLRRIQVMEQKVSKLEAKIENLESIQVNKKTKDLSEDDLNSKITRTDARNHIIDKLRENNPNYMVEKANRAMGGGIILTNKNDQKRLIVKFYHSKSFKIDFPSGWHTVAEEDLQNPNIDYFIFSVEYKKEFYTFIFTRLELQEFCQDKIKDSNNNYHFYFHIKNGNIVECRDFEKDVSRYLNRWDIF